MSVPPEAPTADEPMTSAGRRVSRYDAIARATRDPAARIVHTELVAAGTGYGFRVAAGQTFRLSVVDHAQIADVCFFNADDLTEHYAAGTQLAREGGGITRHSHIWGTAPRSRPLATCVADTIRFADNELDARDHATYTAHCNPHHWMLFTGTHPRTCYDNLRAGLAMLGLGQRHVHDNINVFQKCATDARTGQFVIIASDAVAGDFLEFYAEVPLLVAISLCPYGDGAAAPDDWNDGQIPLHPISLEVIQPVQERA